MESSNSNKAVNSFISSQYYSNNLFLSRNLNIIYSNASLKQVSRPGSSTTIDFLKIYFDVGFYMLIFPFRLKKKDNNNIDAESQDCIGYEIYKSRLQKILCAISHSFLIYDYFCGTRNLPWSDITSKTHTATYFEVFSQLTTNLYKGVLIKILWRKGGKIHDIIAFIQENSHLAVFQYRQKIKPKFIIFGIISLYILHTILYILFGFGELKSVGNLYEIYGSCLGHARYNFFLSNSTRYVEPDFTTVDVTITICTFFGRVYRKIFSLFADGLIIMGCLTLWTSVRDLRSLIVTNREKDEEGHHVNENCVKTNFSALKTLSSHINSFFGPIILCFTMDSLFYNSTDLNAVLIAVNWLQGISSVTFLGFFVIILFLCGDIGLVVETSMRTWIDEMQMMKSKPDNFSQELPLLLEDVKRNAVGISGYIFVMNYTSIFNIIATIFTYFIICTSAR